MTTLKSSPHLRAVYDAMGKHSLADKSTQYSLDIESKNATAIDSLSAKVEQLLAQDASEAQSVLEVKLQAEIYAHSQTKADLQSAKDALVTEQQARQAEINDHQETDARLTDERIARAKAETTVIELNRRLQDMQNAPVIKPEVQPINIDIPVAKPIAYELDITRDLNQFIRSVILIPKE